MKNRKPIDYNCSRKDTEAVPIEDDDPNYFLFHLIFSHLYGRALIKYIQLNSDVLIDKCMSYSFKLTCETETIYFTNL